MKSQIKQKDLKDDHEEKKVTKDTNIGTINKSTVQELMGIQQDAIKQIEINTNSNIEEKKLCKRIVKDKKPHTIFKIDLKKYTEQLNLQNLLHSLSKGNSQLSSRDESGAFKNNVDHKLNEDHIKDISKTEDQNDTERVLIPRLVNKQITPIRNERNIVIKFGSMRATDDSERLMMRQKLFANDNQSQINN